MHISLHFQISLIWVIGFFNPLVAQNLDERISVGIVCDIEDETGYHLTSGSGFLITSNGEIVTCYHVIQDAKAIRISYGSRIYTNIIVQRYSEKYDLAVLKIENFHEEIPKVNFETSINQIDISNNLKIIGYPRGLPEHTISGRLTKNSFENSLLYVENGQQIFDEKIDLISIDCSIYKGLSGSPVIYDNKIIGVVSGSINEGGSLSWAIPAKFLGELKVINARPINCPWSKLKLMRANWSNLRNYYKSNSKYHENLNLYLQISEKQYPKLNALKQSISGLNRSFKEFRDATQEFVHDPSSLNFELFRESGMIAMAHLTSWGKQREIINNSSRSLLHPLTNLSELLKPKQYSYEDTIGMADDRKYYWKRAQQYLMTFGKVSQKLKEITAAENKITEKMVILVNNCYSCFNKNDDLSLKSQCVKANILPMFDLSNCSIINSTFVLKKNE